MQQAFWKLSMGREDFPTVLDVFDHLRRGVVLVHKDTRPKGTSAVSQGENFVAAERDGDYFYVCHGNQEPSAILFGQFVGPANLFSDWGDGWAERGFRWIRTAIATESYDGPAKWWAPNHNSTFVHVPQNELADFEMQILEPFFDLRLQEFQIG